MTTVSYNNIEQVQYYMEVVYPELLRLRDPSAYAKDKKLNNKLVLSPLPQLFAQGLSGVNNLDDEVEDEFLDQNDNTSLVHSFVREEDSAKKESIRIIRIEDES